MDHLANFFSSLQNAQQKKKPCFSIPFTKISWQICALLHSEGLLQGFSVDQTHPGDQKSIRLFLKYQQGGSLPLPIIHSIQKISLQGRRVYAKAKDFQKTGKQKTQFFNSGLYILSTSKGIMSSHDAQFFGIGGEVLCHIRLS